MRPLHPTLHLGRPFSALPAHVYTRQHSAGLQRLPDRPVDMVRAFDGKHELIPMRWGLIPWHWKNPLEEMKLATFNARVETVANQTNVPRCIQTSPAVTPAVQRSQHDDDVMDLNAGPFRRRRAWGRAASAYGPPVERTGDSECFLPA